MPFLLIETSTEHTLAALMEGEEILFQKEFNLSLNNSKYLASSIQEGLCELGITVMDLSYIVVGIGPGSYTGIRVGVMLAKALAYAANIPLIGVSTLKCFVPPAPGAFVVLVDARIGGVYAVGGKIDQTREVKYRFEPKMIALDQVEPLLQDVQWIVTPQAKVLKLKLEACCPNVEWLELPPNPWQMAYLAKKQLQQGNIAVEETLELMYLRKTQAEIEKERNHHDSQK